MPLRVTVDGLPDALCAMDREADFVPGGDVGAKVTVTVCAGAPGLTVNDVGLTVNIVVSAVPVRAMEKTVSAALPVLPTVNVF